MTMACPFSEGRRDDSRSGPTPPAREGLAPKAEPFTLGEVVPEENGLRQVPSYRVHAFHPRQHDLALCVFVLNEKGKLLKQLERMRPDCGEVDVIIADGGSTDGGTEPLTLAGQGVNALLVKLGPGGLATQMRMAFAWALDRGYAGIITMDGNNKDGPEAIPRFVQGLRDGDDHLQGSRFIPGGVSENLPWLRWLGIRCVHAPLIARAARFPYTDTTNGFRAYSRRFLLDPRVNPFRACFAGYELHYYLAIRAGQLGYRVREVPVARCYPAKGPTPTKISPVRGNLRVLGALLACCLGRYNVREGAGGATAKKFANSRGPSTVRKLSG